jgi:hypothetical protein
MLALGLTLEVLAGLGLLQERFANAPWRHAANHFLLGAGIFVVLRFLLDPPTSVLAPSRELLWWFLLALAWGVAVWLRDLPGVFSVICLLTAAYLWRHLRSPFLVAGWLWAALWPLTVPWPNKQRLLLAALLGGATSTLQGAWDVVAFLCGRRPEWRRAPAEPVATK